MGHLRSSSVLIHSHDMIKVTLALYCSLTGRTTSQISTSNFHAQPHQNNASPDHLEMEISNLVMS